MARRWNKQEEDALRDELAQLYVEQNKTIGEIAAILKIHQATVFDRMRRLGIPTTPSRKQKYLNRRPAIRMPERSEKLAEFLGIMLGDGHLSHFQTSVTLGTKELEYVEYVAQLMSELFSIPAHIAVKKASGYRDVYIGSVQITRWLREQGLVTNKVRAQVGVPGWIYEDKAYMRALARGFFDTDGSIYCLRFGMQISITNKSLPLLLALQDILRKLGYRVSEVSAWRIYITKREDIVRFFSEINPRNSKHCRRFDIFTRRWRSGKRTRL